MIRKKRGNFHILICFNLFVPVLVLFFLLISVLFSFVGVASFDKVCFAGGYSNLSQPFHRVYDLTVFPV